MIARHGKDLRPCGFKSKGAGFDPSSSPLRPVGGFRLKERHSQRTSKPTIFDIFYTHGECSPSACYMYPQRKAVILEYRWCFRLGPGVSVVPIPTPVQNHPTLWYNNSFLRLFGAQICPRWKILSTVSSSARKVNLAICDVDSARSTKWPEIGPPYRITAREGRNDFTHHDRNNCRRRLTSE